MPTVIKANQAHTPPRSAAFNFDDMAKQAQKYLDTIRVQAEEILAQARQDAQSIRQGAEKQGRDAGHRAVEQMVEQQVARQMTTLLPALRQAVHNLEQSRHAWLTHWEARAVHVVAAMAARVVRRELAQAPQITLTLVREALELAAGSSQVQLHLNPADCEALKSQVDRIAEEFSRLSQVTVVADPDISPGGCRLETQHGVIDQQFEAQLARIEAELT